MNNELIDCPLCGGLGGNHWGPCDVCDDQGKVMACPVCHGAGAWYDDDHPAGEPCPNCGGTGIDPDSDDSGGF